MHAAPLQPPENRPAPAAPSGYCQSPRREKQSSGGSQSGNEKIQHQRAPWLRAGWPELVTAHHPDWEVWAFYVLGTQVQLVSGVAHGTRTPRIWRKQVWAGLRLCIWEQRVERSGGSPGKPTTNQPTKHKNSALVSRTPALEMQTDGPLKKGPLLTNLQLTREPTRAGH